MKIRVDDTGEEFELAWTDEVAAALRLHEQQNCKHPEVAVRQVVISGGGTQFRNQCLSCGELLGRAIAKSAAPANAPPNDEGLLISYSAKRKEKYYQILREHANRQRIRTHDWWAKYNAYLKTPEWRSIRYLVLKRSNAICEGCGISPATQVHHLTYEHVGNEFLFELVALCDACHGRWHNDRGIEPGECGEELPCCGCRWQSEKDHRAWCEQFDVYAVDALLEEGPCGPKGEASEPLR